MSNTEGFQLHFSNGFSSKLSVPDIYFTNPKQNDETKNCVQVKNEPLDEEHGIFMESEAKHEEVSFFLKKLFFSRFAKDCGFYKSRILRLPILSIYFLGGKFQGFPHLSRFFLPNSLF